jgi:hypothetical protein
MEGQGIELQHSAPILDLRAGNLGASCVTKIARSGKTFPQELFGRTQQ